MAHEVQLIEPIEQEPVSQSTALVVLPAASLPTVMAADGAADILSKLKAELAGFKPDVTTPKGKREIASKAYKVAVAKQDLVRLAGTLKEDAQKTIKGVNAEVKIIEAEMDALRDAVRKPLDDYEAAEAAREQRHRDAILEIEAFATIPERWPSGHITTRLEEFDQSELLTRDWQEFAAKAKDAIAHTRSTLERAYQAAMVREAEEVEAERKAAAEAEEHRQTEERERREHEERIAAEAAERARHETEERARLEREAAEAKAREEVEAAARREQAAREATERAERERVEAEARAEAARVGAHVNALQAIVEAPGYGERETSAEMERRLQRLREWPQRDWEEYTDQAAETLATEISRTEALLTKAKQREADQAEAERIQHEQDLEHERKEAAEAERKRIEQEETAAKADADRRAANIAHRRKINRDAVAALVVAGVIEEAAIAAVTAIAKGDVPRVTISY